MKKKKNWGSPAYNELLHALEETKNTGGGGNSTLKQTQHLGRVKIDKRNVQKLCHHELHHLPWEKVGCNRPHQEHYPNEGEDGTPGIKD